MIPRRYVLAGLGIALAIVLAVILRPNGSDDGNQAVEPVANVDTGESAESESEAKSEPEGEVEGEEGRGGAAEAQEEAEVTEKRLEALAAAKAGGEFGQKVAATSAPASGWVGSKVLSSTFDDWEPAVATDPKAPYVYLLTTRYGARGLRRPLPDAVHPDHDLERRRSDVEPAGADLRVRPVESAVRPDHRGRAEHRRRLLGLPELRPAQRLLNGLHEVDRPWPDVDRAGARLRQCLLDRQARDHDRAPPGRTSTSRGTGRRAATSTSGISHDFGETWTQKKLSGDKRYYYAYDAPRPRRRHGHLLGDQPRLLRPDKRERRGLAPRRHLAGQGRDLGERHRGEGAARRELRRRRLRSRLLHRADVRRRRTRRATSYSPTRAPRRTRGPQRVYVSTSTNGGRTWSAGVPLSVAGENATQPRLASSGGGDVRIWYMQTARPRPRRLERLVPKLGERRGELVVPGEDQRRPRRRGRVRRRERLRRDLRRLRRDRRDEHGQDRRRLGRGLQLHGPRRHLVQHPALIEP